MKKRKTDYDAPDISVTQVEVESALCGSAKIESGSSEAASIVNQNVNTDFNNGGWVAPSEGVTGNTGSQWFDPSSTNTD